MHAPKHPASLLLFPPTLCTPRIVATVAQSCLIPPFLHLPYALRPRIITLVVYPIVSSMFSFSSRYHLPKGLCSDIVPVSSSARTYSPAVCPISAALHMTPPLMSYHLRISPLVYPSYTLRTSSLLSMTPVTATRFPRTHLHPCIPQRSIPSFVPPSKPPFPFPS